MFRLTVLTLLIGLTIGYSVQGRNFTEDQGSAASPAKLDGVYEFVSELTVLTEPEKAVYKRAAPEWSGMWQFQNGYFSRILMKRRRDHFFNPRKREDLGFESIAGRYKIEGGRVRLIQNIAFHPFEIDRSALMDYRFDGNTLVLSQALLPYIEDLRKGTATIVLRRLE